MKVKSKKWMGSFILGYTFIYLFTGLARAQTTGQENWVYIYDNPYDERDELFQDIMRGPDGYIYITGSQYYDVTKSRISLTKLNPATGDTVWNRLYNAPGTDNVGEGYEIDFDGAGNIYVAGAVYQYPASAGRWGFTILKYDPSGNLLHSSILQYISDDVDKAYSVDVGPDNMVYVAGYVSLNLNNYYVVRKYDTSLTYTGRMLMYDYYGYECKARRVRVDSDLNVWSCGTSKITSGNLDFVVVQCDTHLTVLNYYKKNGAGDGTDEAYDLCLTWNGTGVYACGYLDEGNQQGKEFTVVKLDANCSEEWFYQYDNPNDGTDEAYRVINGPGGATYAAGYSIGDGTGNDYTVICLSGFLEETWVYTYNGTQDDNDRAKDIVLDPSGNFAYAGGYIKNTDQHYDFFVTKHYCTQATPIWEYIYDGPANECDIIRSVDVSTDGNLYVAGNIELDASYYEAGAISLPQNFPPSIPELISPVDLGFLNDTTSITFTWGSSEDPETAVQNYTLQYDIDSAFTNPDSFLVTHPDTSYTTALNDTIYYWMVKARDTDGNECVWSEVWSFAFDFIPPDVPMLISPIGDVFVLDTSVTFDWGTVAFRDVPSPVRYVLQVDTDDGFTSPVVDDTSDVDSATIEFPSVDNRYHWRVKAYDLAGNNSSYSDSDSFKLDVIPPLIESTTVWTDTSFTGPFGIYTKVTDLFGVDSVILYFDRMEDPGWFPREMLEGSSDDIYFKEIPQVTMPNDTVKYYIYTKDNAGHVSTDPSGAPENYYWFIAGYDPGVMDFDTPTLFSFGLKNNPTKGNAMFNLALPEAAIVTLRIYDVSGRLIDRPVSGRKSAGYYEIPWTENVSSGIFFYHLDSPWQKKIGKLVLLK